MKKKMAKITRTNVPAPAPIASIRPGESPSDESEAGATEEVGILEVELVGDVVGDCVRLV